MIKARSDCKFYIVTKRIDRFDQCIPNDWNTGYDNVYISSTVENQSMADYRLPILLESPVKHKAICVEPLLEDIDLSKYLSTRQIHHVIIGGESGKKARVCNYKWVRHIVDDCNRYYVPVCFKQTGSNFVDEYGTTNHYSRPSQIPTAATRYGYLSSFRLDRLDKLLDETEEYSKNAKLLLDTIRLASRGIS